MASSHSSVLFFSSKMSLEPFETLANSQPIFNSVGTIKSVDLTYQTLSMSASGVCVAPQIVITAAHCIKKETLADNSLLTDPKKFLTFTLVNKEGKKVSARIIKIIRHPDYKNPPSMTNATIDNIKNDIAVLLLDRPLCLEPATPDYSNFCILTDCTAVAFTPFFKPRRSDDKRYILTNEEFDDMNKVAAALPDIYSDGIIGTNIIGYDTKMISSTISYSKRPYNILESGCFPGMSGGACFVNGKLIGILCASLTGITIINNEKKQTSHKAGEGTYVLPLFHVQAWIKHTISTLISDFHDPKVQAGIKKLISEQHFLYEEIKKLALLKSQKKDSEEKNSVANTLYGFFTSPMGIAVTAASLVVAALGVKVIREFKK